MNRGKRFRDPWLKKIDDAASRFSRVRPKRTKGRREPTWDAAIGNAISVFRNRSRRAREPWEKKIDNAASGMRLRRFRKEHRENFSGPSLPDVA